MKRMLNVSARGSRSFLQPSCWHGSPHPDLFVGHLPKHTRPGWSSNGGGREGRLEAVRSGSWLLSSGFSCCPGLCLWVRRLASWVRDMLITERTQGLKSPDTGSPGATPAYAPAAPHSLLSAFPLHLGPHIPHLVIDWVRVSVDCVKTELCLALQIPQRMIPRFLTAVGRWPRGQRL